MKRQAKSKKSKVGNRKAGSRTQPRTHTGLERMEHPPQINSYEITHAKRLRFTVTAAVVNQFVYFKNLLDAVLVATSATVGYDLFDVVRVIQTEVWSIAALGTPTTVQVEYSAAGTGDQSVHTDTSLGVKPAYVRAVPDRKTLAGFFQITTAGLAFLLTAPAGSVVDVSLEFRTSGQIAPTVAGNALVGATVGQIYFRGLDGVAAATTNFPPPSGLATI